MGVTNEGIFYSSDNGDSWIKSGSDNTGSFGALDITSDGLNLYAARGSGGISRSTDNGVNWSAANTGLPANSNIWSVFSNGNKVFAGRMGGLYISTNSGDSWSKSDSGITGSYTFSVIGGRGDTLFAGTAPPAGINGGGKVLRSFDGGNSWTDVSPLSYTEIVDVNAIFVEDSIVLLGTQDWMIGILHSTDWGDTWSFYSSGNTGLEQASAWGYAKVDSFLFVGMGHSTFGFGGIYRRTKYTPWVNVSSEQMILRQPPLTTDTSYLDVWTLAEKDGNIFASLGSTGLYRSTDKGDTWTQLTNYISSGFSARLAIAEHNGSLYVGGASGGVFISTDNGNNWKTYITNVGIDITSFTFIDNVIFLGENVNGGVRRSTDGGHVWWPVNNGLTNKSITKLASGDNIIYAGTSGGGLFSSTNMGDNWINTGWDGGTVIGLYAKDNLVIASQNNKVHRSTNFGNTWSELNDSIPSFVYAFASINNRIFAGGSGGATVAFSDDDGATWNNISGNISTNVFAMVSSGDTLYAATETVVYYTTDFQTWTAIPNDGLGSNIRYRTLLAAGGYIYAGMGSGMGGAFRRQMSGTTSIENITTEVPDKFMLEQNYPNPFNPTATIQFKIGSTSYVSLKIYDALGGEIAALINEEKPAGIYNITFDARGLSSGVYFYKLQTDNFSETKKMILLR